MIPRSPVQVPPNGFQDTFTLVVGKCGHQKGLQIERCDTADPEKTIVRFILIELSHFYSLKIRVLEERNHHILCHVLPLHQHTPQVIVWLILTSRLESAWRRSPQVQANQLDDLKQHSLFLFHILARPELIFQDIQYFISVW